jgi:peroxiredoxin Q/BCP
VRELREFRAHHEELRAAGLEVAGVSREPAEKNRRWTTRLDLPYPVLSDPEGEAAGHFGVVRRIGIGGWKVEFFRRSTFLIDTDGVVAAVWGDVKVRGHARDVLAVHERLARGDAGERRPPAPKLNVTPKPRASGS